MRVNVLLISILQNSHRNLSILSLYSYLKENSVDVKVLFLPQKNAYSFESIQKYILENEFNVFGISLMTDGLSFAVQITNDIKASVKESVIVWGGIHPTLKPDECLQFADCVCVGEGEYTFLSMIQRIETEKTYDDLPGVGTKLPDKPFKINPPAPLITDLDILPFVRYDWENFFLQDGLGFRPFDVNEYTRYSNYHGEDYTLMATRSCPFSCSYCCNSFLNRLYKNHGKVRKRSVDNVISELKCAIANIGKIRFVNFIDDQFFTSKEWTEDFIVKYRREIGLPFIIRLVPETIDEDTLKKCAVVGLKVVQIGLQSGSDMTHREIFHRRFNKDKLIEVSQILSRNKVFPIYDVIIQNDLEADTDRDQTIELLLKLKKPFSFTLFVLTLYPHTELEQIYRERQITPRTDPYGKGYADYREDDFYFQLCTIIPYTPHYFAKQFFRHKNHPAWRFILKTYYQMSKNIGNKRRSVQGSRWGLKNLWSVEKTERKGSK